MNSLLRIISISLLLPVLLAACAHSPAPKETVENKTVKATSKENKNRAVKAHPTGQKIADLAKTLVGSPYKYGGESPKGFDCSGLVFYTHRKMGLRTPRTSLQQYKSANKVSMNKLRSGDLIFFKLTKTPVSHVGIYVGNGRFIHAPQSGKQVKATYLSHAYWSTKIVSAGRLY